MTMKPSNIFISWSGPRSKHVASVLRLWLPDVLQSARPWMSDSDIDKGSRGIEEISKALDTIEVGISCLTPENLVAPWLLFEGGALSKRIGDKTRLCTYLLGGLKNGDVPQPLGMFQHTVAEKTETRKMLESVNLAINPTEPVKLDRIFDKMWPDLEEALKKMPNAEKNVPAERPEREMIAEILDLVRGMQPSPLADAINQRLVKAKFYGGGTREEQFNRLPILQALLEAEADRRVLVCKVCGSGKVSLNPNKDARCLDCGAINSFAVEEPNSNKQ